MSETDSLTWTNDKPFNTSRVKSDLATAGEFDDNDELPILLGRRSAEFNMSSQAGMGIGTKNASASIGSESISNISANLPTPGTNTLYGVNSSRLEAIGGAHFPPSMENNSQALQTKFIANGTSVSATNAPNSKPVQLLFNITDLSDFLPFSDNDFNLPSYADNFSLCSWNDTLCSNLTLNATDAGPSLPFNYWSFFLMLFPIFTLFGNILVVMSVYREKTLRTVTNYFIVSLAVADILVAVLVMPLAVYVEANNGNWDLGDILCDAWVAFDVCGCTASILNLTAISVDRFIAVTQPIKYAKHKNSKRVYIMLAMTWIVSITICAPIALGMNYTDSRKDTPELCIFYNSDFLIFSSMGSFYIPCVIMLILYGRIFYAIRQRAKKAALHKKRMKPSCDSSSRITENKTHSRTTTTAVSTYGAEKFSNVGVPPRGSPIMPNNRPIMTDMTSVTNAGASDTPEESSQAAEAVKSPASDDTDHVTSADKSTEPMLSPISDDSHCEYGDSGYSAPTVVEVETPFTGVTSPASPRGLLSPPSRAPPSACFKNGGAGVIKKLKRKKEPSPKKAVTRFNFHIRHSKKKKDRSATRRERKATKTLAIVLGVFLLCWMPFFTVNIINAFCIRYSHILKDRAECNIDPVVVAFFVWLGYLNSFLNPVIYTIFNIEFRKAFKKILTEPCKKKR